MGATYLVSLLRMSEYALSIEVLSAAVSDSPLGNANETHFETIM